ncbi:hypothetical protein ACNKHO_06960 [Shigella flexneri]
MESGWGDGEFAAKTVSHFFNLFGVKASQVTGRAKSPRKSPPPSSENGEAKKGQSQIPRLQLVVWKRCPTTSAC